MTTNNDYLAISEPNGRIFILTPDGNSHLFLDSTFNRRDWQDEADRILSAGGQDGHTPRFARIGKWKWNSVTGNHYCSVNQCDDS